MTDKTKNGPKKAGKIALITLNILFIIISVVAFFAAIYTHKSFPNEKFDELYFYIMNNSEGDGQSAILSGIAAMLPFALVLTFIFILLNYGLFGKKITVGKNKKIQFFPIKHLFVRVPVTVISCVLLIAYGLNLVGFFEYMTAAAHESEFIALHYSDPSEKEYNTDKKKNLIYIEIESMETTMFTKAQGGQFGYSVIPEMYELLDYGIYFSSDNTVGGTADVYGTTWTTAALVSYTSGLPFKMPAGLENAYHSDNFMGGAYALGDILKEQGYSNYLISCARTSFGGVADYFTSHGEYEIIDVNSIRDYGYSVPVSQDNEWGFSDEAGFEIAKKLLSDISERVEPFNLMISTIDTHFTGYLYDADEGYEGSVTKYERNIDNAYATTSRETKQFVDWLKEQDFFEDTVIVIAGDHNNMSRYYLPYEDYEHTGRYNLIINSSVTTDNTKNRVFTSLDFYPTVLSAMGYTYGDTRLGLGTDLFSSDKTLAERYGADFLSKELEYDSDFYNSFILGDDWEDIKKKRDEAESD